MALWCLDVWTCEVPWFVPIRKICRVWMRSMGDLFRISCWNMPMDSPCFLGETLLKWDNSWHCSTHGCKFTNSISFIMSQSQSVLRGRSGVNRSPPHLQPGLCALVALDLALAGPCAAPLQGGYPNDPRILGGTSSCLDMFKRLHLRNGSNLVNGR